MSAFFIGLIWESPLLSSPNPAQMGQEALSRPWQHESQADNAADLFMQKSDTSDEKYTLS